MWWRKLEVVKPQKHIFIVCISLFMMLAYAFSFHHCQILNIVDDTNNTNNHVVEMYLGISIELHLNVTFRNRITFVYCHWWIWKFFMISPPFTGIVLMGFYLHQISNWWKFSRKLNCFGFCIWNNLIFTFICLTFIIIYSIM